MKKYDIYGIGNALVDTEIEINNEELSALGFDKGTMTLIDDAKLLALREKFTNKSHQKACGGSAANTVIGAAQFGSSCFYSCKVANDSLGHFYIKDLKQNKVSTNLKEEQLENGTTGTCLVFITPDAERTMTTFLGITSNFSSSELSEKDLLQSQYLYMEGYLATSPTGKNAAVTAKKIAQENNIKTALSFSDPFIVTAFKESLLEMIGDKIDLLFCNESEALLFTGKETINEAIIELAKIAKTCAITLGSKGALIHNNLETIEIIGTPVQAIDTNGAGDLFAGAFLSSITKGKSLLEAGKTANSAAAKLVTQFGPRLKEAVT